MVWPPPDPSRPHVEYDTSSTPWVVVAGPAGFQWWIPFHTQLEAMEHCCLQLHFEAFDRRWGRASWQNEAHQEERALWAQWWERKRAVGRAS